MGVITVSSEFFISNLLSGKCLVTASLELYWLHLLFSLRPAEWGRWRIMDHVIGSSSS